MYKNWRSWRLLLLRLIQFLAARRYWTVIHVYKYCDGRADADETENNYAIFSFIVEFYVPMSGVVC